jgi:hypothetical protein
MANRVPEAVAPSAARPGLVRRVVPRVAAQSLGTFAGTFRWDTWD